MSRVNEIRYVGYAVKDFGAERQFYTKAFGLEEIRAEGAYAWFKTLGHDEHHVVRLRRSDQPRIDVIALATGTRADVDALHKAVQAAGCRVIHGPEALSGPGGGYGFRFFSPDGLPFEVSSDVARGAMRELHRWEALPLKISHIVLHSPNQKDMAKFFVDVLGFRVSDWLGDFMVFLRCNRAHHRIAILPGPPCLNHVAYDMLTIDDMMRGGNRMRKEGFEVQWGPGRHTAGNNTFSYFVTPSGNVVEYTSELEIVDDDRHVARVYEPAPMVMDQWGMGVGGPQKLPQPAPDGGLFQPAEA